jgi:hypothetical protein
MTSMLEYIETPRRPNPMVDLNPLAKASESIVGFDNRIEQLEKFPDWKKNIKAWQESGRIIDLSLLPKYKEIRLGDIRIDEDIQRELDAKHCAKTIGALDLFDPRLCQPAYCAKTSDGVYRSCDAQHTYSTIAAFINAGLVQGIEDWREFKITVVYIESDDMSFVRKAFGIINGRGKKPQTQYQMLKTSVFCVRLDGATDNEEDVSLERKVSIAERNNCYAIEKKGPYEKYPNTFTHISSFVKLSDAEIDLVTKWHNDYLHFEPIHACEFVIFKDLSRTYEAFRKPITDELLSELAGLITRVFWSSETFGQACMGAFKEWSIKTYGYEMSWKDVSYANCLMQLYVKMGGQEFVPQVFLDNNEGIADFFADDIRKLFV